MTLKKFIRLDMKGHWRGREHVSSVQGMGEEFGTWEKGISCYCLDDPAFALEQLRDYWFNIACIRENDLENMQVTVFEGYKVGMGADWEDVAECENTLMEFPAKNFMLEIHNTWEKKEWEQEISEEEYEEILLNIYKKYINL